MADLIPNTNEPNTGGPVVTVPNTVQTTSQVITKTLEDANTVNDQSSIFGVSVRSIICLMLVGSVCAAMFTKTTVPELVGALTVSAISYYFGHQSGKNSK